MATNKVYTVIDCKEELYLVGTVGEYKGFKQSLLIEELNELEIEFYVCTRCKGIMRNACMFGGDQISVCQNCIDIRTTQKTRPMLNSRKKIPELRANCPLATRGCKWNATLSEVSQHLDVCQEFIVECKYDCGIIIKRCELNNHCNNECLNRKVSCEHCRSMIVYKELNQHFKECAEFPLLCLNNCATSLKRKQIDSHIETDCPNTVVECRYERFGCKQVVKRCEMEEHKKTNEMKHLEMTTFFAVDKIEKLEETNSKLSKEVIRIRELEKRTEDNMVEIEKTNKKQFFQMMDIIESLSYPVVLRDLITESNFNQNNFSSRILPLASYDISWRFINLSLMFGRGYPVTIIMVYNKVMSPQLKWPFKGRFKLTIIDRVNRNNSLVYESAVVKLQPKQLPELKDYYPNEFEIARIPRDFLLEKRFRTQKGEVEFTLQIQEAENINLLDSIKKKEFP